MTVNPDDSAAPANGAAEPTEPAAAQQDAGQTEPPAPEEIATVTEPSAPEEIATVTEDAVRVHRSPRYFRFMLTGAILFAVVAVVLTFAFPENPTYDRGTVFGFLLAICVVVGVALGAVVALLLDRAATRRARTVQADRIDVRVPDGESEDPRSSDQRPSVDS
ncbi:hypothetical protein [uncultured Leifsonia sp.]|uniref:hypothetical protein n=1 Tax=uncultured Leifsonia sp. TaxID=340359 RepID=UPI0028D3BF6A|nr:hypothetical protein [uncultured Leifsonia sp.]